MGGLLQQGTRSQGPLQLERCVGVSLLVLLGRSRPVGSGLGFRSAPKGLSRPEPIPISFSRAQNNVRNNSQSRELPDQVALLLGWAPISAWTLVVRVRRGRPPDFRRSPSACGNCDSACDPAARRLHVPYCCQAITLLPA